MNRTENRRYYYSFGKESNERIMQRKAMKNEELRIKNGKSINWLEIEATT